MLLAIDVGNTNSVFAVHDGAGFVAEWRCATDVKRTADEYFVWLNQLMAYHDVSPRMIDGVVIAATAAGTLFNLRVLADRYFNTRPMVVGKPDCALPVAVRVDAGTQVGPDRLVNAAGAHDRHGGDLIVVDFGTATTFDVVAKDGAYEGGVIAPGVNLSLEALHQAAAALPHVDITQPDKVIGTNTVACIQSGIFWGYVGLVRGLTRRVKEEYGVPMKVVGTGGLAPLFAQGEELFDTIEDDLTQHGLRVIHAYNKEQGNT